eukprot:gene6376-10383_t
MKKTILDIKNKFKDNIPITMLTAYDYSSSKLVSDADIDMILVGDSLGMVMLGRENTVSVTMNEMLLHCKSVSKGSEKCFLIGDMPYGSYEVDDISAVQNAMKFLKEGNMDAIKLEADKTLSSRIRAIVNAGVPVMGHIGLTPQRIATIGGFKVQGNTAESAKSILEDALALEKAGCFAIVLECVPERVAKYITEHISIPTIGIGAGKFTSGQVLVYHDILGIINEFDFKFSKKYANLQQTIVEAISNFKQDVEERKFPTKENSFLIKKDELKKAFPDIKTEKKQISEEPLSEKKKMKIAIIGAGSLGLLFASKLVNQPNCEIIIISSNDEKITKIRENGIMVRSKEFNIENKKLVKNLRITNNIKEVKDQFGEVDLVVMTVKSPYTREAAKKAKEILSKNGHVLTLQNGIGNVEEIQKEIKFDQIIEGITYQGCKLEDDGIIYHNGAGLTSIANSNISNDIKEIFVKAGIDCEVSENFREIQWGKLVVNSAINPITALFNVKNGFLTQNGELNELARLLVHTLIKEAVTVCIRKGIKLPYENAYERTMEVAKKTFENESSMLTDFIKGNETEIDFINGKIIEEANKIGVSCEMNKKIINLIHQKNTNLTSFQ